MWGYLSKKVLKEPIVSFGIWLFGEEIKEARLPWISCYQEVGAILWLGMSPNLTYMDDILEWG